MKTDNNNKQQHAKQKAFELTAPMARMVDTLKLDREDSTSKPISPCRS